MSGEDDVTFGYRKGYDAAKAEAARDIEALRLEVVAWRATAHAAADLRDKWHRRAMDALKLLDEVAPAMAAEEPEAPPEPERPTWVRVTKDSLSAKAGDVVRVLGWITDDCPQLDCPTDPEVLSWSPPRDFWEPAAPPSEIYDGERWGPAKHFEIVEEHQ